MFPFGRAVFEKKMFMNPTTISWTLGEQNMLIFCLNLKGISLKEKM
jgi:hypothetical protein